jgi:Helix-hairpin-helix motif
MKAATAALVLVVATTATARAHEYETFVDIENEDDLYDLQATGQIGDDTFETLDELLARGVDLNEADREELYSLPNLTYADVDAILEYRRVRGKITDPSDLVGAGALTQDKLLAISAFLVVRAPTGGVLGGHGMLLAQTRWSQNDRKAPPLLLRGRLLTARHLSFGFGAVLDRLRIGQAVWDPNRGAILADAPGLSVVVPKVYARYQDDRLDAIIGSYRVGFGERLTFDDSFDYTPNGIYADDQLAHVNYLVRDCKQGAGELETTPCPSGDSKYITPDYTYREALFGAAAGARRLELGQGYLQLYGWGSYHRRSIYQYELVDADRCADPRKDADAACGAPDLLLRPPGDVLTPTPGFNYQTVPDVFREALVGANATYFADRRTYLGLTGYGAQTFDLMPGANLDYQEWSNRPGGARFGALGVGGAIGRSWLDVAGEVTRSFDDMHPTIGATHGGGGNGAVVRATATGTKQVLEASVRYYGVDFVNPYAKPIAARDEFEGQRARDEVGGRLRYLATHGDLYVRAQAELWNLIAEKVPRTDDYVRLDYAADAPVGWGLWLQFEDKDLTGSTQGDCFDTTADQPVDSNTSAPTLCKGMRLSTTARLHLNPSRQLQLTAQATHRLLDDPKHMTGFRFRNDVMAWLLAQYRPSDRVRIHGRARYLFQDVATRAYLEESLWTYGDVTVRLRDRDALRVRADLYWWLDQRPSSQTRSPNPELWLWLEYEAKF